ncbi:hypothetical protein T05_15966 [Trichinella murrelli]|uniref:Uncharacterized protein n=1 Tax=Trichinella murrelli TaxID=144512 RepID=A0A0V0T7D8_9BILA|nr:hypothetical protein T05_15966 [Trichinella murrelli]
MKESACLNVRSPTSGDESAESSQEPDRGHVKHDLQVHRSCDDAREQADVRLLRRPLFIFHVQRSSKIQPHSVEWECRCHSFRRKVAHQWTKRTSVVLLADDASSDASLDCLPGLNHPKATPQGCQDLVQSSVQFRFMS